MNVNHVILGGNLTRDPELRYTPGETAVLEFTIAVNRTWKSKDGEQKKEASFVGCTAFGRTAELIKEYLQRGSPILIEGRIKIDQWETEEGKKQSKTKVLVEKLHFVGAKKQEKLERETAGEPTGDVGEPALWGTEPEAIPTQEDES